LTSSARIVVGSRVMSSMAGSLMRSVQYIGFPGAAQHVAKRSGGALQTRDRYELRARKRQACDGPGSAVHRFALHPGNSAQSKISSS
jgi:hypothetical protein